MIVDLPPGTGDVQLTLSQDFKVSAAVLITTPQRLSFVDVVKGVEMFDKVGIPTVAVVENMAGFSLDALAADADAFAAKVTANTISNQACGSPDRVALYPVHAALSLIRRIDGAASDPHEESVCLWRISRDPAKGHVGHRGLFLLASAS